MTRVIDAAIGATWAMEEAALRQLLTIAHREHEITPEALEAYRSQAMEKGERAKVRDGVAILSAEGPLFRRANMMTEFSGASSYEVLMRDFTAAADDGNIRAILVNIYSPGGEVSSCAELAGAIAAARGRKPIVAYASDLVASAAYWIASACDQIVIGPSAQVGSIGVRCSITDTSGRDARAGLSRFEFVSSQSPFKVSDPKTDDGAARLQARVDALASVFVEAVAVNRGVSVAHVLDAFGKGDVLIGQTAIDAGMVDGFGSFESVLASLAAPGDPLAALKAATAASRGYQLETAKMPTTEEMNAAVEAARVEATAKAAEAHAAAIAAATAKAAADTTAAADLATKSERERVAAIHAAAFAGYEKERDEAIQSGSPVGDFKALIVEKEHAKAALRSDAVSKDVKVNAGVHPGPEKAEDKTEGDQAVTAILGAFKATR